MVSYNGAAKNFLFMLVMGYAAWVLYSTPEIPQHLEFAFGFALISFWCLLGMVACLTRRV